MATAEILNWWASDLPREYPKVLTDYLVKYPDYQRVEGSDRNPVPFPEQLDNEMVLWYDPSPVVYNSFKQGLVTALQRGWSPEAPAEEEGEAEAAVDSKTCDVCGTRLKTQVGLKIHKRLMHK